MGIQLDLQMGAQSEAEILADPGTYPILSPQRYPDVYRYLETMKDKILNTGHLRYRAEFPWKIWVIDDRETVNAFATPGGYLFIYTGLLFQADNEAQVAGVLAHEMSHSDLRHSVEAMGRARRGPAFRRRPVLSQLRSLKFTRAQEAEADEYSVLYICSTDYHAPSITGFFENLESGQEPPKFLSTHPSDQDRVRAMNEKIEELGYSGTVINESGHRKILNTLPRVTKRRDQRRPIFRRR
jgi:predicted Zn-dependent protease